MDRTGSRELENVHILALRGRCSQLPESMIFSGVLPIAMRSPRLLKRAGFLKKTKVRKPSYPIFVLLPGSAWFQGTFFFQICSGVVGLLAY